MGDDDLFDEAYWKYVDSWQESVRTQIANAEALGNPYSTAYWNMFNGSAGSGGTNAS